jgi:Ni/Fe-hydrogenase 1 B-type cytochrome subunit
VSDKASRQEHPLPAVLMHWAHLLSFFILIATGQMIHSPWPQVATMQTVQQIHFISMYIFVLTTIVRIYWAFFGAGSANVASTKMIADFKHFGLNRFDWRTMGQWIKYYLFMRKTRPYTAKYNPLQKITYGFLFPLGTLFMALTGFAMFQPTAAKMMWFANIFGGQNGTRLAHYWCMWVLIVFFMVHLYLVVAEDIKELPNMLARYVPRADRVAGDYPVAETASTDRKTA